MRNALNKTVKLLLILTLTLTYIPKAYAAADFEINTDYKVSYQHSSDFVTVTESVHINVNSPHYYLPAGTSQEFEIPDFNFEKDPQERSFKINSISLKDSLGNKLTYQTSESDSSIRVTTKQPVNITTNSDYTIIFSYKTHELVNHNGNIVNLYVPGLPKNTPTTHTDPDNNLVTSFGYNTELELLGDVPETTYIQPEDIPLKSADNKKTYTIETSKRLGRSVWIQLGSKQFYYFKIVQPTPKTDNLTPENVADVSDYISTNVFTLPLPRNYDETNQKVFVKSIDPQPSSIETDAEGNLTALFEVPANKTSDITIEGYISLDNSNLKEAPVISLDEYLQKVQGDPNLEPYTLPDKYWESDNSLIIEKSDEISVDKATVNDLIKGVYQSTIDTLEYSTEKVSSSNERSGALKALTGSPAVCMEYSDLAVALLRAQGIPARAAVGYGNDPTGLENNISDLQASIQQIGHQWVQVWLPDYGWYSIDPTWGESGRTYLGTNLDHLLWYTLSNSEQEALGGTSLSSADNIDNEDFQAYQVYIQSLSEADFTTQSTDTIALAEYLIDYQDLEYSPVAYFLKTTVIGRALIVSIPILALIAITFAGASLLLRLRRGKTSVTVTASSTAN